MYRYLCPLVLLFALTTSCTKEAEEPKLALIQDRERDENCRGTACTAEFGTTRVDIISAEGVPISVSDADIKIYYTKSEAVIEYDRDRYAIENDEIIIASDDYIQYIAFDGISITVEVNKDGYAAVSKDFIVTRDCCHVLHEMDPPFQLVLLK